MNQWTKLPRYVIAIGIAGLASNSVTAWAQTTTLNFTSLPSAQGWTYHGTVAESNAFSVANNTLSQTTVGYGSDADGIYEKDGFVNTTLPFELDMTARVTSDEGPSNLRIYGFSFEAESGSQYFAFSVENNVVEDANHAAVAINTSVFHNYQLDASFSSASYVLYIDGVKELTGTPTVGGAINTVDFGDGTPSGGNANAQITHFSFTNGATAPEPGVLTLLGVGMLHVAGRAVVRRRLTQ